MAKWMTVKGKLVIEKEINAKDARGARGARGVKIYYGAHRKNCQRESRSFLGLNCHLLRCHGKCR